MGHSELVSGSGKSLIFLDAESVQHDIFCTFLLFTRPSYLNPMLPKGAGMKEEKAMEE
jgi:hypothetical protein